MFRYLTLKGRYIKNGDLVGILRCKFFALVVSIQRFELRQFRLKKPVNCQYGPLIMSLLGSLVN